MNSKLGKLIAVHSTSPAFLQRAAIVAALAFLFFLANFIFYLVWQSFAYFILATGFLVVQIFTMTGWWMQRRRAVSIYANGLVYRKREIFWNEIAGISNPADGGLKFDLKNGGDMTIPASIQSLDRIEAFVNERSEFGL